MFKIKDKCVVLSNGKLMPLLGLGCWQSPAVEVETAVEVALDNGYRHIDTAYNYLNEEAVGRGIKKWLNKSKENKREHLFIVTKLPMIGMYAGGVEKFFNLSLTKLGLSYVDLYLVHCPFGMKGKNDEDVFPTAEDGSLVTDPGTDIIAIWKDMEKKVDEGLTKSIGISNFSIRQMRKIMAIARIPPTVNQVEMHVNFQQNELVQFCKEHNIVATAYGPLGSPGRSEVRGFASPPPILSNPIVQLVADNHKVTTAQVLIKFWIQQGIVAIPKSVNADRIKINGDVFSFTLSETEMDALKLLDKGEQGRSFNFLQYKGAKEHPECPIGQ